LQMLAEREFGLRVALEWLNLDRWCPLSSCQP
jgi:hypothetical protein